MTQKEYLEKGIQEIEDREYPGLVSGGRDSPTVSKVRLHLSEAYWMCMGIVEGCLERRNLGIEEVGNQKPVLGSFKYLTALWARPLLIKREARPDTNER